MKGILEFELPVDNDSFQLAQNAVKYSIVIEDFDNWLRSKFKYEDQKTIEIEEVREKLTELMRDNNLI